MLSLKLGSKLPNLFKKPQSVLKIWTKCRLNFHKMECTGGGNGGIVTVFLVKYIFRIMI